MRRSYIGELELMVLLAVVRLGDEAYGVPISKELLILANLLRGVAVRGIACMLEPGSFDALHRLISRTEELRLPSK